MKKLYVESIPLVEPRPSGVGHSLAGLVSALVHKQDIPYDIVLVAPRRALAKLDKWPLLRNASRKGMPLRMKVLNGLIKFHLLPRVDWLIGEGIYLFGNFKNWPLSSKSSSLTFIHDICYELFPEFVSPPNRDFLKKNVPYFMKRTNIILTVSEQSKREICTFYKLSSERVGVVYNGVDHSLYNEVTTRQKDLTTHEYEIDRPYFIYVGNIEPRKNLTRLVGAFSQLPEAINGKVSLVLVGGNGWLNEETLRAINLHRTQGIRIVHPDKYVNDNDLRVLVSGAIALVQPSIHEGFSMPPLEALAAGTLVAASDIPVHKEIIGNNAVYFDPYSEDSITSALSTILRLDLADTARIKRKGLAWSKKFSWDRSADQLLKIIKNIDIKS